MTLIKAFDDLFDKCHSAFNQTRTWDRAKGLAHGILNCMGRSTITGWLVGSGLQFKDWSANYKLFSQDRVNNSVLFSTVRREVISLNDSREQNIYVHMDDTLFRKKGKKLSGAKWFRDPLGPPFHTNFVWGQRFLQISMSLIKSMGGAPGKTIPVDLVHCPLPVKPKKGSDEPTLQQYLEDLKKMKISKIGSERINLLRINLNTDGYADKRLVVSVDGGYTNQAILKNLSDNITIIGRIRKDARLNSLPQPNEMGRKRIYGESLPTPEQIRLSADYPWQQVNAWASGKLHIFDVKIMREVRWRKSGLINLQLVIIKPVAYRLSKNSPLLYRDPAFLICTDPDLEVEKLLQAYLCRWGIEVNFKEQKTVLGCGKAQVRKEASCQNVPAFHTAVYSMLLTAAAKYTQDNLPRPKWYQKDKNAPPTTGDLINLFRASKWAENMAISFSNFVKMQTVKRSRKNSVNPSLSSVLYCRN